MSNSVNTNNAQKRKQYDQAFKRKLIVDFEDLQKRQGKVNKTVCHKPRDYFVDFGINSQDEGVHHESFILRKNRDNPSIA